MDMDDALLLTSPRGLARLAALAAQSATTIPYYQQVFGHVDFSQPVLQLADLPMLTKEQVRQSQDLMVIPEYLQDQPDALVAYTSGSTGVPLRLVRRRSEMLRAARALWKARMQIFPDFLQAKGVVITNRIDPGLANQALTVQQKGNRGEVEEMILVGAEHSMTYLDAIDAQQPAWLAGPPALLMLLADTIRTQNRPLSTKLAFVESRGSILSQPTRDVLAETFGCLVVNHYGCEETQTIAYECAQGEMHLLDDCAVVELHPQGEGAEYEIVVSTLIFETMPFLRYRVGDLIHVAPRACSCGNANPVLGHVMGRVNDAIAGTALNGPYTLHLVVQQVLFNLGMNPIVQYQVHQTSLNEFEMLLILDRPELLTSVTQEFQRVVANILPAARFAFRLVKDINPAPNGKLQPFVRHI